MPKKEEDLSKENKTKSVSVKKGLENKIPFRPFYIILIFIIVLILTFLALYIALSEESLRNVPTCGDGTFYGTCSLDRPYYCEAGKLIERASLCGCEGSNSDFVRQGDFCVSEHNENPEEISLKYVLNGQTHEINFTVYGGVYDHVLSLSRVISLTDSEIPFRSDFKLKSMGDDIQRANILPLVKKIQNLAPENKADQARIAISIVQNIPYGFSNKTLDFEGQKVDYPRYPYEVLFENQGICGEKSDFMALLLKELGFGVSIFYFAEENHEAVGIKCPVDQSLYGTGFCFVETGSPAIITDYEMEFVGGTRLESEPKVVLISEGISLPDELEEYDDARTLSNIREGNFLGILNSWRHEGIIDKYLLDDVYRLDDVNFVVEEEIEGDIEEKNSETEDSSQIENSSEEN